MEATPPLIPDHPVLPDRAETTLDPDDWETLRALGHRMVDDLIAYHATIGERPAWQTVAPEARRALGDDFERTGVGEEAAYEEFSRRIKPFPYGNLHPRGWGWVNGTGTTIGALAEMWGAAMNSNAWAGDHAAPYVEAQVLSWLRRAFGMPDGASGVLVSGGSVANLVGLAAARAKMTNGAASEDGVRALPETLVAYASDQVHNSVDKAVGLLGIGWRNFRRIPTDSRFRMDVGALADRIAADRRAGLRPACVVATVGTVNTGAIDPVPEIASVCEAEGLWLHVDGAFGALCVLSPTLRPVVRGIERADSLAFDLHKWLYVPIEAGGVFVRDPEWHRRPFSPPAPYLTFFDRGPASGSRDYSALGPQLTRSFRALKVWLSLRAHGTAVYGDLIEQNVRQARHLAHRIEACTTLELLAPVSLNVVCFRYRPPDGASGDLDALNRELLLRLQESGVAIPSGTVVRGDFALRVAFTNHRTRIDDVERFVEAVSAVGSGIEAETGGRTALKVDGGRTGS